MQKPRYYLRKYPNVEQSPTSFISEFTKDFKSSGVALSVAEDKLKAITNKVPYETQWNPLTKSTPKGSRARLTAAVSVLSSANRIVDLIQFDEVTVIDYPKHQYSALIELDGEQFWVSVKYVDVRRNHVIFKQDMKDIKAGTTASLIAARNHVKVRTKGQDVWVHRRDLEVEYDLHDRLWTQFLSKVKE